ncbi:MAG: hypothetical protein EOO06_08330 [Chitinophagaceae bacterium]|nr:MAG: hypothetical protein EOO06_08330 [Chitinophagaceae bacterium]
MKQFFLLTIFFAFAGTATIAQTSAVAKNIQANIVNNKLVLSWTESEASETGSWEVQASANGKDFTTIGLVWGADPKGARNSFSFKQESTKIQSKFQYFRVLYVAGTKATGTSAAVRLAK